jgi:hypothetical protein
MPLEHIKAHSSWQKFQRGEVATVIVPAWGAANQSHSSRVIGKLLRMEG